MQNRSWFPWFLLSAGRRRCEARPSKNWRQCVRTVATEDCSNWEKMLSAPREQTLTFGSHTPAVSNPRQSGRGTPDLVAGVKVTTRSWLCPLEAKKLLCHVAWGASCQQVVLLRHRPGGRLCKVRCKQGKEMGVRLGVMGSQGRGLSVVLFMF